MTDALDQGATDTTDDDHLAQAVEWFLRVRSEGARAEDLAELQRWMQSDPQNAVAYRQVSASWNTLDAHASAPEIVIGRRDALEDSRKAARSRWSAKSFSLVRWALAASVLLTLVATSGWWFITQRGDVYTTDLGERRTVTLPDGSVVTLNAKSRLRVKYAESQRVVALERGQARFSVAKDPLRPFRVTARNQTVVALGTQFDVELVGGAVLVTLIEGHVAVAGVDPHSLSQPGAAMDEERKETATGTGAVGARRTRQLGEIGEEGGGGSGIVELTAGEELRIRQDGRAVLLANVDVDHSTAWQSGKLFFENEPLASAVERVNRYVRRPIVIDPSVANVGISGVFNAGDADAFVEAVTAYFPIEIASKDESEVRLTARK